MRPVVATVLTARRWEADLVAFARRTGRARIVGRAYEPEDLDRMGPLEFVAVASGTAWLSPALIRSWRRRGWRVLGIHPPSDTPGRRLLEAGGSDLVAPEGTPPDHLVRMLVAAGPTPSRPSPGARLITVTGARGAPGRTTIALALARVAGAGTLLLDADPLPTVGPVLGLGPGPGFDEVADVVRGGAAPCFPRTGDGLAVLSPGAGPHPLAAPLLCELALGMRLEFTTIILETGPPGPDLPRLLRVADRVVLVVDGTPHGLIRAGRLVRDWSAERPDVILNRVRGDTEAVVRSCRSALGLEPTIVIPRVAGDPIEAVARFLPDPPGSLPPAPAYSAAAT